MAASPRSPTVAPLHRAHHRARFPSLTEFPDSPSVYPSPDTPSSRLSESHFDTPLNADDDNDDDDDCTDDASHRISLQGPKIRFHSRAPWETEDVDRDDVSDSSPRSGTFGSKLKGKAARADSLIRSFTRGRPSVDSARSRVSTTSFETNAGNYSSSHGALYDLARQSISTSSLSSSAASPSIRTQASASTFNYPQASRDFPQTHSSLSRTTVSLDGVVPPVTPLGNAPMRPSSSDTSRIGRERSAKPYLVRLSQERQPHCDDFVHPYANPDLVVPYTQSPETIPSPPILGDMSGSDSNSTVTDSTSMRSAAFSVMSTETSTTSLTSRDISYGNLRVNGKEISSPISVLHPNDTSFVGRNTRFLSLHPPPPGFDVPQQSNLRAPAVTLISLQEAQARERIRSNTVHTTVARSRPPFSNADDIPETTEDHTEETDAICAVASARVRSTSAGTHQKTAPLAPAQSLVETTEEFTVPTPMSVVHGRVLKHKKSGFMRLFGGRSSEGEKEGSQLPPVPPFGDGYAEQNLQVQAAGKPAKLTRRVAKPSSSPTLRSANNTSSGGDGPDGKGPSPRRRHPPSLCIVTKSSDNTIAASLAGQGLPAGSNFTQPHPLSLTVPQSAPPGNTDFPGLQLRPVSASFSSHFADIVAGALEDSQRDVDTPSSAASSSTALSPFTPVSTRRSDDASAAVIEASGEENPTIEGLQDQLMSAKKAWQQQVRELRGRIRDLTVELEDLRARSDQEYCEVCGRGEPPKRHTLDEQQPKKVGVVNRPRVRTGDAARFANGG